MFNKIAGWLTILLALPLLSLQAQVTSSRPGFINGYLTARGIYWGDSLDLHLPQQDGTSGQTMTTDGSGELSWTTLTSSSNDTLFTGSDTIAIVDIANKIDSLPLANKTGDGLFIWGTAGDTTRPGFVYTISTTAGQWVRVDTSVTKRGLVMAMDSVLKGALCRFLKVGTFRKDDWNWSVQTPIYSDSATAGEVNIGGQATPKKMQYYGTMIRTNVMMFDPENTISY